MADRLRIALIGCGSHGAQRMAPAIRATDGARLVAVADLDLAAARAAASNQAEIFETASALVAAKIADAAVIAVPHDALAAVSRVCIEAGLPVLVEKPVARDRAELDPVVEAAQRRGVPLMPAYCQRFTAVRTQLHALLARGIVGEVTAITGSKGGPPLVGWLADPARSGGQLAYLGSHLVDQTLWLHRARVRSVFARLTDRPDSGGDETTHLTLAFDDGVAATLLVTQATGVAFDTIEVTGRAGRARSDWKAGTLSVQSSVSREFAAPTTWHVQQDHFAPMYAAEVAEFVAAVQGGHEPSVSALDALRVLAVLDAARRSGAQGVAVDPDDPWDGTPRGVLARRAARQPVRIQFTYPADKIQSPFVYELSRRFQLVFDIRRADIDAGIGWVQVQLEGERSEIDAAIQWAEAQGVHASPVEGDVYTQ
ncbi:MAG: Gfo/Idh/MocA family oxidoreductase [Actinobacteria bacterium]|nr:Gfo/Idh/MocA family oxidoreductase [Actinomycetota bacterium]